MKLLRASNYNIYLEGENALLIWNTLSGRLDGISNTHSLYKFYMKQSGEDGVSTDYLLENQTERLDIIRHVSNGFLTKDADDSQLLQASEKSYKARNDSETLGIVLTATLGCNFGCSYCCQGTEKDFAKFEPEIINQISNIFIERKYKNLEMIWYGGEPLLMRQKIKDASAKLNSLVRSKGGRYTSSLVTNGSLLNLETTERLVSAGINNIHISIDGSEQYHNGSRNLKGGGKTYQIIMDNINQIESSGLAVRISIRVNHYPGFNNIDETVDDFCSYGASHWKKTKIYLARIEQRIGTDESAEIKTNLKLFTEDFKRFSQVCRIKDVPITYQKFNHGLCSATDQHSIVLSPSGDIHKCWDTVTDKEASYGSILSSTDENILGHNNTKWTRFDASTNSYCRNCKLLPVCGGSCAIKHFEGLSYDEYYHSACPSSKLIVSELITAKAKQNPHLSKFIKEELQQIPIKDLSITERVNI